MFKGYNPLNGNGINTKNTDPVKKNAKPEGTMTSGGAYGSPQEDKKVGGVTFESEGFNSIFEKDIPKPGVRAPKRNYSRSHASGLSTEKKAQNLQTRLDNGTISQEKYDSIKKRMQ